MAVFQYCLRSPGERERKNRLNLASFLSAILLALFLISTSIDSIGPQMLIIGEKEEQVRVFNQMKLSGMNFNRSSLSGVGNFYGVDYVVYGFPKNDLLRVAGGEYYESGTWYTNNTVRHPYSGEIIPFQLDTEPQGNSTLRIWVLIDTKSVIPEPDYPRRLEFLVMNYSRGIYRYIQADLWNCSYDETLELFWTNKTIMPWEKYTINYYTPPENQTQLEIESRSEPRYTQVPEEIEEKLKTRAKYVTEDTETDYEKIQALIEYLQTGYQYSELYMDAPYGMEPVLWFLFTEHKGISIHFNTALALMARTLNIPSRVVGGYPLKPTNVQFLAPWDRVVYTEFWFKDVGWVRFDATPEPPAVEREPVRSITIRTGRRRRVAEQPTEDTGASLIIKLVAAVVGFFIVAIIVDSIIEARKKGVLEEAVGPELVEMIDDRLGIRFKEIEAPLLNVWGIDEPLTVIVQSQLSGELYLAIEEERDIREFTGEVQATKIFSKGSHTIKATLITEKTGTEITSRTWLRIVDYREEVVELFNQILKDPELAANWWKLTAREIQSKLSENYPMLSGEAVERYATIFEVADYSQHDITREWYVRFYLAKKELEEEITGGETE